RTIQDDIGDVKKMLLLVGDKINNIDIPGLGSGGYFKDFISGVVKPLSKEELADDEKFGENAQNLASTLIMGLKTLNGEKDANGYYDKHVGESLKKAILTNPQFAPIRNALNDTLELEGGKIGFYGFDPSIKPTDAQRKERGQYLADLMNYEKREPIEPPELAKYEKELEAYRKSGEVGEEPVEPPEVTKYMAAMDVYEEFGKKNKEELKGIERLNTFFISMNNLQENGHYDNEQARGVNKYNMMLDFASKALDKYFPGLKNTIKSFFTNNSIGQLLGSVLGYKGIDIARLWGEKRNLSDPLEHVKQMKKDFGKIYDEAAKDKDLGDDAKPAEIVEKAQEMANDGMNKGLSGVAFKAAMRLVYKGEDKGFMQKVINNAYDAAEGATSKEEASTLFAKSVQKALDGKEFSVQEKSEIKKDAQELEKGYGDQVPAAPVNAAVAAQTMVSPPKSIDTPAAVDMKPADSNKHYVDTVSINVGNQIVCLSYAPREEAIDQGPLRLSKGRVEVLQDVLA
ncbi:MAG: hypothetical protein KAJ29_07615, partial [Alphaproteobacteria bacterium]|nr:hypothetical protein [Alphaproteobacteria bacterium]